MKVLLSMLTIICVFNFSQAQTDKDKVERACLDYLEGFYDGDTAKITNSIKPTLHKLGYWKTRHQVSTKQMGL